MTRIEMLFAVLLMVLCVLLPVLVLLWRHEQRSKERYWEEYLAASTRANEANRRLIALAVAARSVVDVADGRLIERAFAPRRALADLARAVLDDANREVLR